MITIEQSFRSLISIIAIACNFYIFFELTLLIFETLNVEENLGIILLPLTLLVHSMIAFSVLGFFNLNKLKHGNKYLYVALIVSALTIIFTWVIISASLLIIGGFVFWLATYGIIRYLPNLNAIPVIMNLFIILVAAVFLHGQV